MSLLELAQSGDLSCLKTLLNAGATDPNEVDESGYTALYHATNFDECDCVEALLGAGANVNNVSPRGSSALHVACSAGAPRVLALLLEHSSAAVILDHQNNWGETALHSAVESRHVFAVRALLSAGASATILDNWSRTPLDVCVQLGSSAQILDVFKEFGILNVPSSISAPGEELKAAERTEHPLQGQIVAEFMDKLENFKPRSQGVVTKGIFASTPTSTESTTDGPVLTTDGPRPVKQEGPVMSSMFELPKETEKVPNVPKKSLSKMIEYPGDPSIIKALLEDSAVDAKGKDMFGVTALMKFAAWDKVDLLELLLSKVCEDSIYLNLSSPADGFTALHHAASMNARRTFSVLSTISVVDATLLDKQGYRATELAIWLR